VILRRSGATLEIDSFIMSCRVLQRGVEQLAMNKIFEHARRIGARCVVGRYIPTAKNAMVKTFYERFRFTQTDSSETEGASYSLEVDAYETREVFIRDASARYGVAAA
jgi:predicted enzyme involved in methoxymalonyl-ACP biosynthesis